MALYFSFRLFFGDIAHCVKPFDEYFLCILLIRLFGAAENFFFNLAYLLKVKRNNTEIALNVLVAKISSNNKKKNKNYINKYNDKTPNLERFF